MFNQLLYSLVIRSKIIFFLLILFFTFIFFPDFAKAAPAYDDVNGIYTDDFATTTGLSTQSGAGANTATGKVQLRNASNGYTAPYNSTGYVRTATIRPLRIAKWVSVNITGTFPEGTEVKLQILDEGNTIYPDIYLTGNSSGLSTFPVDIGNIPPFLWADAELGSKIPTIRLKFILTTTNTSITPEIDTISLNWILTQGDLSASTYDSDSPWASYFGTQKGFYALKYSNSSIYPAFRWASEKQFGNSTMNGMFVLDDKIFASQIWQEGHMFTLNRDSGEVLSTMPWAAQTGFATITQNGTLYGANVSEDITYAIDINTLMVKWVYNFKGGHGNGMVTIGDDGTIFTLYNNNNLTIVLYAFNPDSSIKFTKSYTVGEAGDYSASLSALYKGNDGTLYFNYVTYNSSYIPTNHAAVVALDPDDGTILWQYPLWTSGWIYSFLLGPDDTIYVANNNDAMDQDIYLIAINPDGSLKWSKSFGSGDVGSYTMHYLSSGKLLVEFTKAGWLLTEYTIDPNNGSILDTLNNTETTENNRPDSKDGIYFNNYPVSSDPTITNLYYSYRDSNHNLKWQIPFSYTNTFGEYTASYNSSAPQLDERGWIYYSLGYRYYDQGYNNDHTKEFTQIFALAPWVITSSLNSNSYKPNEIVEFSVTSSMQQINPVWGGDNKIQVVMDNGDIIPLSYSSINSLGDTIWTGSYTLPGNYSDGNHTYTVEAAQSYLRTDISTHFSSAPNLSDNTGIRSDFNICLGKCEPSIKDYIQIPGMSNILNFSHNIVVNPIKDSNTGGQQVFTIIEPGTFNFDAFLSVNKINSNTLITNLSNNVDLINSNLIYTGDGIGTLLGFKNSGSVLWQVGQIQEIWYKTYSPDGYKPANIIPQLQKRPSIVALNYQDHNLVPPGYPNTKFSEDKLKIAHSLDGKNWSILSSSVTNKDINLVAAFDNIGGYYMIVGSY